MITSIICFLSFRLPIFILTPWYTPTCYSCNSYGWQASVLQKFFFLLLLLCSYFSTWLEYPDYQALNIEDPCNCLNFSFKKRIAAFFCWSDQKIWVRWKFTTSRGIINHMQWQESNISVVPCNADITNLHVSTQAEYPNITGLVRRNYPTTRGCIIWSTEG